MHKNSSRASYNPRWNYMKLHLHVEEVSFRSSVLALTFIPSFLRMEHLFDFYNTFLQRFFWAWSWHDLRIWFDTVDGWNPAPPGMYRTLEIYSGVNYLTGAGFQPWTVALQFAGMGDLILDSERMPLALVPVSIAGRTVGFCLLNKDDFLRIVYSCAEDPIEKTLNTPGRILYCHHRHSKSRGLGRGVVCKFNTKCKKPGFATNASLQIGIHFYRKRWVRQAMKTKGPDVGEQEDPLGAKQVWSDRHGLQMVWQIRPISCATYVLTELMLVPSKGSTQRGWWISQAQRGRGSTASKAGALKILPQNLGNDETKDRINASFVFAIFGEFPCL